MKIGVAAIVALLSAQQTIFRSGVEAVRVDVLVTRGSQPVPGLKATDFEEVIVTNTLPIPEERRFDSLTVLSIAPLIARAIREVFEDGSVTSLFNGQA